MPNVSTLKNREPWTIKQKVSEFSTQLFLISFLMIFKYLTTLSSGIIKERRLNQEDSIIFTDNILVPGVDKRCKGVVHSLALAKPCFCSIVPYLTYFLFYSFLNPCLQL